MGKKQLKNSPKKLPIPNSIKVITNSIIHFLIMQDKIKGIPWISKNTLNITDKQKRLDNEIIDFYDYVIPNDYEKK